MNRTAPLLAIVLASGSLAWGPFDIADEVFEPAPAAAPAQTTDEAAAVVAAVQAAYDDLRDFSGSFRQSSTRVALGDTRVSTGEVAFLRPGKMLWDYAGDEGAMGRILLLDGEQLWSIDLEQEQYYSAPVADAEIPVALRFLVGQGRLEEDFVIMLRPDSTASTARLDLVPRVPTSDYSRLRLVVDRATSRITETTIVDALGNTNTITFANLRYNSGVDAAIFVADIPAGFTRISVPDDGG